MTKFLMICGWVPKGRLAEDGPISAKYQLKEMPTYSYEARTEQNVIDSDFTWAVYQESAALSKK